MYRDVELPAPAVQARVVAPSRTKPPRVARAFALLCVAVASWWVVGAALAKDRSSPCNTSAHSLAAWHIPRILPALFLPSVVSVRDELLWRPRILSREGHLQSKEYAPGCRNKTVVRASTIVVTSKTTWLGRRKNSTFTGVTAACIQHALDFVNTGCA